MNENPLANPPVAEPAFACSNIVYRAALDPTWFSTGGERVDPAAFYCRRGENGISIGLTPEACRGFMTEPIDGIISVHVGRVRDITDPELAIPLDVEIDDPPHGIIKNVPPKERKGPRRRLADRIASLLARQAARPHEIFIPPR